MLTEPCSDNIVLAGYIVYKVKLNYCTNIGWFNTLSYLIVSIYSIVIPYHMTLSITAYNVYIFLLKWINTRYRLS